MQFCNKRLCKDIFYNFKYLLEETPPIDVEPMLRKKYTVMKMFNETERFFTSLGWPKLPESFWENSVFVQPEDRKMDCAPSAWDLIGLKDGMPDVR